MIQKPKLLLRKSSFWKKYEKNTNLYVSLPEKLKQQRVPACFLPLFSVLFKPYDLLTSFFIILTNLSSNPHQKCDMIRSHDHELNFPTI